MALAAKISLASEGSATVGRERIRLLQAVAREGSISAGARAVGLSYKAAWDGLEAMANLFGTPLLRTQAGGRAGGGAVLTAAGMQVIRAFDRLEAEMQRLVRAIEPDLAGTGISPLQLVSGFVMKTSARNALRGTVVGLAGDSLTGAVAIRIADETVIRSVITQESVRELGLHVGREVVALIKAPFVVVRPAGTPPAAACNSIAGTVRRCEISAAHAEAVIAIGGDKTLAATMPAHAAEALGLLPGLPVCAEVDPSHVIIAID